MTLNHLFSPSLFLELFQHDIVASDGHILASDEGFQKYREFLMDRSKMRTAQIFQKRKGIVDKLQSLMKTSIQPTREVKILLKKLGLHPTEEGTVTFGKAVESQQDLGPSHIKRSLSERRVAAHKTGLKVQTRDLKHLDDWLSRISGPKVRVKRAPERTKLEWKREEFKYRAKLESVLQEMAKGRHIFVKKSCHNVQYKWISAMERILENIAESKKLFDASLKDEKEANVLSSLKGDREDENVFPSLKGGKESGNVLDPSESESTDWPSAAQINNREKAHQERVHREVGILGVEMEDTIVEFGRKENRTEEMSAEGPDDDEDDNVLSILETGSKTENRIPVAEPDDRIVDFGRDGKWTEETNAESPVDDERFPETGNKTEKRMPVAEPEDRIVAFGSKGYWAEKTSSDNPVEDEDENVRHVPKIGIKTENLISVAKPKEIIEAESEEAVTLDVGRRTAYYRKETPKEDGWTEGSNDALDYP